MPDKNLARTRRIDVQHSMSPTGDGRPWWHQHIWITEKSARTLQELGMIYPCDDDDHDLHLDPTCEWTLEKLEVLLLAAVPVKGIDYHDLITPTH
jgi:hypothetical protein